MKNFRVGPPSEQQQDVIPVFEANSVVNRMLFKEEAHQDTFDSQLIKTLHEVKKYINGQLNAAVKKGRFPQGKYNADEIIDTLFIEVYEQIAELKKEKDFYFWLFKKTNKLLKSIILEEEYDEVFIKNIHRYTEAEWDAMAENFSMIAEDVLLIPEKLNSISCNHNKFTLRHVFAGPIHHEIRVKIEQKLSADAINRHIHMVLYRLPQALYPVFELYTHQQFSIREIAEITSSTVKATKKYLHDTRIALQISLLNRCVVK